jgi:Mu-like prophage FluMu protein gp28
MTHLQLKPYAKAYQEETRIPAVFLPYQQDWVADKNKVKVYEKSRRIGISWAEAADATLTAAAAPNAGGMNVWYIGYNKEMAIEFIRDVANWAKHFSQFAGEVEEGAEIFKDGDEDKSILTFSIKFASGFRVTALSSAPNNLRGKQGLVIIDEAAFHPNLDELLKAALALIIWGGAVHIISTHNGVDNKFNELVEDIRNGKEQAYTLHTTTFSDAVEQGLYKRICLTTGEKWTPEGEQAWVAGIRAFYGDKASEELDCIPSRSSGSFFSRALVEARMNKDLPVITLQLPDSFLFEPADYRESHIKRWLDDNIKPLIDGIPKTMQCSFGQDFARSSDLSSIMPGAASSKVKFYTPFILEMRNVPFETQKQILFYICDRLPDFQGGAIDSNGNGAFLGEVAAQRYGETRILRIRATQEWYRDNMPKYKACFEDEEITLAHSEDIINDHRCVQLIKGVPKVPDNLRTTGADGNKRHGDTAIAGCLLKHAMDNCGGEFEYYGASRIKEQTRHDLQGFLRHG